MREYNNISFLMYNDKFYCFESSYFKKLDFEKIYLTDSKSRYWIAAVSNSLAIKSKRLFSVLWIILWIEMKVTDNEERRNRSL